MMSWSAMAAAHSLLQLNYNCKDKWNATFFWSLSVMHNLYVPSVIIYSQHSDISIKAGVALHLAHFSLYNFLSLFIYPVCKPRFFLQFFTKQKQKQNNYLQQFVNLPVVIAGSNGGIHRRTCRGVRLCRSQAYRRSRGRRSGHRGRRLSWHTSCPLEAGAE